MAEVSKEFCTNIFRLIKICWYNPRRLDKRAAISQTIYLHAFSWLTFCILNQILLKFVPKALENNPALVEIMAWRRKGDKPLSKPMLTRFTDAHVRHWGRWVKKICSILFIERFKIRCTSLGHTHRRPSQPELCEIVFYKTPENSFAKAIYECLVSFKLSVYHHSSPWCMLHCVILTKIR